MLRCLYLLFYSSYEVHARCVGKLSVSAFQRIFSDSFWTLCDSSTTLFHKRFVQNLVKIWPKIRLQNLENGKNFIFYSKSFLRIVWPSGLFLIIAWDLSLLLHAFRTLSRITKIFQKFWNRQNTLFLIKFSALQYEPFSNFSPELLMTRYIFFGVSYDNEMFFKWRRYVCKRS